MHIYIYIYIYTYILRTHTHVHCRYRKESTEAHPDTVGFGHNVIICNSETSVEFPVPWRIFRNLRVSGSWFPDSLSLWIDRTQP